MKQKKRQQSGDMSRFRLVITLSVSAETLGAGEGYLYVSGRAPKKTAKKKKEEDPRGGDFTLSLRNAGDPAENACVCEITEQCGTADWERLPQSDCFRYADARAAALLARVREMTGLDLAPHIETVAMETPLHFALREDADGPLRRKAARMLPSRQQMRVEDALSCAGRTVCVLRKTDGYVAANFRAGQSVRLFLPDGDGERALSAALCSSPALTKEGRYAVAVPGNDSRAAALKAGDLLDVSAPEGDFFFTSLRDHRTVIGVADADGLPSFLSMACAIRDHLENFKLTVLLFGCEDGAAPLSGEWDAVCAACGRVRLIRLPAGAVSYGALKGHLPHEAYSVFICGAADFCETAGTALEPLGLPRKSLRVQRR